MQIGEHKVEVISKDSVEVGCQTVSRSEVLDVLRMMDEWKPAPKFQVGDFVRVRKTAESPIEYGWTGLSLLRGKAGRVIAVPGEAPNSWDEIYQKAYAVEFAERVGAHDANGKTKNGHGYWLLPEMLEKVD